MGFSILSIFLLLVLFPSSEWIRIHLPNQAYRFVAGVILGTYGVLGYALAVHLYKSARAGKLLQALDTNKWMRPFSGMMMFLLIVLSLLTWYVGWEGKNTGIFYGLGVFVGGTIAELGIGSLLKRGR